MHAHSRIIVDDKRKLSVQILDMVDHATEPCAQGRGGGCGPDIQSSGQYYHTLQTQATPAAEVTLGHSTETALCRQTAQLASFAVSMVLLREPLTEFQLFPKLSLELRLKIYRIAAYEPRLIELEHTKCDLYGHNGYQVARQSRKAPVLLQLCRESREEGVRFHEKRIFERNRRSLFPAKDEPFPPYIWFNPHADIIFFGRNTCLKTMKQVFFDNHVIPRVARLNTGRSCCDSSPSNVLRALHGDTLNNGMLFQTGCKGLVGVFIVVKSNLWSRETFQITDMVGFRPATNTGRTGNEIIAHQEYRSQIDMCKSGSGDLSKWMSGNMPKIEFVSLAPKAVDNDPRGYVGIVVSVSAARGLRNQCVLQIVERDSGCLISVPDKEVEDSAEVGFWGTKRQIGAAKGLIGDRA